MSRASIAAVLLAGECIAQQASWTLSLAPDEYAVLHNAMERAVVKYRYSSGYELRIQPSDEGIVEWILTVDDRRVYESLEYSMAEQARDLIDAVDVQSLTPSATHALGIVQSVNRRLRDARAHPSYEFTTVAGRIDPAAIPPSPAPDIATVALELDEWLEGSPGWLMTITGPVASSLSDKRWWGVPIVVSGYVRAPGRMEATRVVELRASTVEVFTMSLCPFGQNAIKGVLDHLDARLQQGSLGSPMAESCSLDVRYIFYKRSPKEGEARSVTGAEPSVAEATWWCMHGEPELHENLVQMLVRDTFPDQFHDYLRVRLAQPSAEWKSLATAVGLDKDAMRYIEQAIATSRDQLIQAEYDYVAGLHGVTDGSPTWIWESRIVPDIRQVKRFKDINLSGGSCAGAHP